MFSETLLFLAVPLVGSGVFAVFLFCPLFELMQKKGFLVGFPWGFYVAYLLVFKRLGFPLWQCFLVFLLICLYCMLPYYSLGKAETMLGGLDLKF